MLPNTFDNAITQIGTPRSRGGEKWLALVALVVVTAFAVALLYPR